MQDTANMRLTLLPNFVTSYTFWQWISYKNGNKRKKSPKISVVRWEITYTMSD